jgi:hypothetical protein
MKVKELIQLFNSIDGELEVNIESSGGEYSPDKIGYIDYVLDINSNQNLIVLSSYNTTNDHTHLRLEKNLGRG